MAPLKEQLEREFVCPKCHGHGAVVQEVALGRGLAAVLPLPPSYLIASCGLCGYSEIYNLALVEKATESETETVPSGVASLPPASTV